MKLKLSGIILILIILLNINNLAFPAEAKQGSIFTPLESQQVVVRQCSISTPLEANAVRGMNQYESLEIVLGTLLTGQANTIKPSKGLRHGLWTTPTEQDEQVQISSGNILNNNILTESIEKTKINEITSPFLVPEYVSGADNKSKSDIESDWIEANPTHIIMIDLFLLAFGDKANLFYQYNSSKSFNYGLSINWGTTKLDDITSKSWEIYPACKWYGRRGNAPNGAYLYSELSYLGGYVDVRHTNTHDRLSVWACGFGIGYSDFWKGKGSETLAGLARGVDFTFGILVDGETERWISNKGNPFKKYGTKPALQLKFGIGF